MDELGVMEGWKLDKSGQHLCHVTCKVKDILRDKKTPGNYNQCWACGEDPPKELLVAFRLMTMGEPHG